MLRKIRGRRANLEAVARRHTHTVEGGRHFKRRERNKSPAKSGYHH